jgi:hypothetical protein
MVWVDIDNLFSSIFRLKTFPQIFISEYLEYYNYIYKKKKDKIF